MNVNHADYGRTLDGVANVPKDDCQNAFQAAALADGLQLGRAKVPSINQRGHLGLPEEASGCGPALDAIFEALGGDPLAQGAKRTTPLPGDFLHEPSGTFIEIDEHQHVTSWRRRALELYPADVPLGFDLAEYVRLCGEWSARADRYRSPSPRSGSGEGGRQRQRAYHDALRDLVTPAMGHPPLVRVPAPDRDGRSAYRRVRDRMLALAP